MRSDNLDMQLGMASRYCSTYHLLSASHDGTMKLWDMRPKVPLHTLEAHKDKVLCADWWKEDCIVSGGADSKMNVIQNAKFSL